MMLSFNLPVSENILIKAGDDVDFTTPLYKTNVISTMSVDLASKLATEPKKIFQNLKKFVGEPIKKGDIIAQSSSFLSTRSYMSEYDGTIKEIDHMQGTLTIEMNTTSDLTANCYFMGEVAELNGGEVKLKVHHAKDLGLKEASDSFGGPTIYSTNPIKGNLNEEEVGNRVVIDNQIPVYEYIKYEALGAKGFVSLHAISRASSPWAQLENEQDYKSAVTAGLPYCIIDKSSQKIFFYD